MKIWALTAVIVFAMALAFVTVISVISVHDEKMAAIKNFHKSVDDAVKTIRQPRFEFINDSEKAIIVTDAYTGRQWAMFRDPHNANYHIIDLPTTRTSPKPLIQAPDGYTEPNADSTLPFVDKEKNGKF